jgi:type II restriction enzyme
LEKLHPDNRHIKDKIRQQLQVLRDLGLLLHIDRGLWRLP